MEIRVLGPLELCCGGGSLVALGPPMQKAVLALLLARANTAVPLDDLVDELWGDQPPASAVTNVRQYVNNLARLLAAVPDGPAVLRHGYGYTLSVDAAGVDLYRFRDAVRRGRECVAVDLAAAVSALDKGLALWRGRPVEDVRAGRFLSAWQARLQEERVSAVEDRADALLGLGQHERVAADARDLLVTAPLRERSHALLARALYQAGDTAAALDAVRTARRSLAEQLGIEPGEELQRLQKAILNREPVPDPRSAAPPRSVVPRQLPAGVAGFAGRIERLRQLDGLLSGHAKTVVISAIAGTGGVGKTALAVHWAHCVAEKFPDGQLYVNLRGFDPTASPMRPAEAVRGFLDAFAVPPQRIPTGLDAQTALYRSLIAGKRVLVVLDNARDAEQVRPLLPASPGCLAVVTSRNQLTGLVAADGAQPLTLDVLTHAEARELLDRRLGHDRVTAEPDAVNDIITRCARLPLALVIAAARATTRSHFPLTTLARELAQASGGLDPFTADDTSTDLRAVFSWSYRALSTAAARLFRLLGLHPGPDISAAAAASLAGLPPHDVRPLLAKLTHAHLLAEHTPGRYTLHDLLRAYAREQAHSTDSEHDRREAVHRTLDHYLHTAHHATLQMEPHWDRTTLVAPRAANATPEAITGHDQAIAWYAAEHRVLLGCLAPANEHRLDIHAWQLAVVCDPYFQRRGHAQDRADTHRAALAAARRAADKTGQALTLRGIGHALSSLGCNDDAHDHLLQALEVFRELDDHLGQAHCHGGLAVVFAAWHRYEQALDHCRRGLGLFRTANHRLGTAIALNNVGWLHAQLGEHRKALEHCQRSQRLFEELDDQHGLAAAWDSVGHVHHCLGDHDKAIACFRRAVNLCRKIADRFMEAYSLTNLGDTHRAAGDLAAAGDVWQRALDILHELDHADAPKVLAKLRELTELRPA